MALEPPVLEGPEGTAVLNPSYDQLVVMDKLAWALLDCGYGACSCCGKRSPWAESSPKGSWGGLSPSSDGVEGASPSLRRPFFLEIESKRFLPKNASCKHFKQKGAVRNTANNNNISVLTPGGYLPIFFWGGGCCPSLQILTLFQTQRINFLLATFSIMRTKSFAGGDNP